MKLILTSLILLHFLLNCDGRPDGAPLSACSTLMPIHAGGIEPSINRSPYMVSAVPTENNKVKVTISSKDQDFQGFVLQARSKINPINFVSGHFTVSKNTKGIDCFRKVKSTLTHDNTISKNEVVTEWTPDPDVNEDVIFRATVAKTFVSFWTELDSQPISIHRDKVEAIEQDDTIDPMYKDCFETKGCFGFPEGCLHETYDCKILLTYYSVPSGVRFSLHGYLGSLMYMAVGLSEDGHMGEDSVNECIRDKSDVIARESWNEGRYNSRRKDLPSADYHSKYSDGLSSCSWVKPYRFESDGEVFDLVNNNYYLLLAKGDLRKGGGFYYHTSDRIGSIENFNLTIFEDFEEKNDSSPEIKGIDFESALPGSNKTEEYGDVSTTAVANYAEKHDAIHGKDFEPNLQGLTKTEEYGDVSTTAGVNYTEKHNKSHDSQLSFNAFYVILALLLAGTFIASLTLYIYTFMYTSIYHR